MNKKDLVVILGSSSFPYEISAANIKNELIARALLKSGLDVTIITKLSSIDKRKKVKSNYNTFGEKNGVKYNFVSGNIFKPLGIIDRQNTLIIGLWNELMFLRKNRKRNITILLSITWFHHVLYYFILSKLMNIQVIISIMEWHLVQENRTKLQRINDYLFDNFAPKLFKKSLPISHFLDQELKKRNPEIKNYILPALTNMSDFDIHVEPKSDNYFLYCGHIGYMSVIKFVILSFKNVLNSDTSSKLHLVINGNFKQIQKLEEYIKEIKLEIYITILHKIPYQELISEYKNALALLIPLRQTKQDEARFPQKIAEYTSSKRPIITNNWGEIPYFFQNNVTAYVCGRYDGNEYASKMLEILNNKAQADKVGENAYNLSKEKFQYSVHSLPLKNFIDE